MASLSVQIDSTPSVRLCGICGKDGQPAGTGLILTDGANLVCTPCGKRLAPRLAALLALADEAARIAKIGRHNVFPPYTALLDLARAAESYASLAPESTARKEEPTRKDEGVRKEDGVRKDEGGTMKVE